MNKFQELMDEYQQLLKRLLKGAEYLSNPLLRDEDRRKGMELYDKIDRRIGELQKEMNRIGDSEGRLQGRD